MNDHSKDSQTRYLREAAIVLAKEGFQLDEVHTDRLCILLDGAPLCEVTENGGITYRNEDTGTHGAERGRTRSGHGAADVSATVRREVTELGEIHRG